MQAAGRRLWGFWGTTGVGFWGIAGFRPGAWGAGSEYIIVYYGIL